MRYGYPASRPNYDPLRAERSQIAYITFPSSSATKMAKRTTHIDPIVADFFGQAATVFIGRGSYP